MLNNVSLSSVYGKGEELHLGRFSLKCWAEGELWGNGRPYMQALVTSSKHSALYLGKAWRYSTYAILVGQYIQDRHVALHTIHSSCDYLFSSSFPLSFWPLSKPTRCALPRLALFQCSLKASLKLYFFSSMFSSVGFLSSGYSGKSVLKTSSRFDGAPATRASGFLGGSVFLSDSDMVSLNADLLLCGSA